jgi:hypothetical protein
MALFLKTHFRRQWACDFARETILFTIQRPPKREDWMVFDKSRSEPQRSMPDMVERLEPLVRLRSEPSDIDIDSDYELV